MAKPVTYESLVQEAVAKCGDDMKAIDAFVKARVQQLPEIERNRILGEVDDLVGFRAPDQSPFDPN